MVQNKTVKFLTTYIVKLYLEDSLAKSKTLDCARTVCVQGMLKATCIFVVPIHGNYHECM